MKSKDNINQTDRQLGMDKTISRRDFLNGVTLDYPVSMGEYHCAKSPDEPIVLHLTRVPGRPGLSAREQFAAGQRDLLGTSFETISALLQLMRRPMR
jgi:spermidine dehydrogenase